MARAGAGPNAEVGSLGVFTVVEDTSGKYAQAGVKVHVVSSAPPIKGAGVDGTEVTPAQLAEWQRRVSDTAEWFIGEVATGRRLPRPAVQKLATGAMWIAPKAQALGLVDGVLTFDEALTRLRGDVEAYLDNKVREFVARQALQPPPRAAAPAATPARVTATPAPALSPAAQLEAQAKAAGLTMQQFFRTPAGAAAYTKYREGFPA